ncbi:hypothetical protein [Paenibacillus taiwanensis]|uniref:hypothetical protein n=1 Tax=Paenibacillus taiwanensis TaxID=401638 RepID=UPI00040FEE36|nr:hypothetical protein [Paenibacillus taiwanensis]
MDLNRNYKTFMVAGFLMILVVVLLLIYTGVNAAPTLPTERLQELRVSYPASNADHPYYNSRRLTFQEVVNQAESIIRAEVIGQLPEYEVDLFGAPNTPEYKVNEKKKNLSMPTSAAKFTRYEVKVIETISGIPVTGSIELVYNSDFKGVEPDLKTGMEIITTIGAGERSHAGKYFFTRYGTYYIVDNDYVLSAVDDDFSKKMNGKTMETLLDEIKEIKP